MRPIGSIGEHLKEHAIIGNFYTIGQIIANYIPYTGANADVDLDSYNLTTTGTFGAGATTLSGDLAMGTNNITGLGTIATASGTLTIDETASLTDYMQDLVDDTSPQLGADLDGQSTYDLNNIVNAEFEGTIGIGAAPFATAGIYNDVSFNTISSQYAGMYNVVTNTRNAVPVPSTYGLSFSALWKPTIGSVANRNLSMLAGGLSIVGVSLDADETKDFTVTNAYGFQNTFQLNSATVEAGVAKFTSAYNYAAMDPTTNANSVIDTLYAFYDAGQTVGDTNWGFYGNSAQNYFGGNVGIGTTSPDNKLTLGPASYIGWKYSSSVSAVYHKIGHPDDGVGPICYDCTFTALPGDVIHDFRGYNDISKMVIREGGNVGIGTDTPTSPLHVVGLPTYANNADARTGGLTTGAFYSTDGDPDYVCVVHDAP